MSTNPALSQPFLLGGDLPVNRLGYGAMHLTGYGMWGPPADERNAIQVLRHAVYELGINFIDTADSYGPGDNEEIIRKALHPYPKDLVICTKGGMLRSGKLDWIHDAPGAPYIQPLGDPRYLRQQVELSLRRLGVDCIALYQLHSIDPKVPLAESLGELVRLQEQGKIRHIGLSNQPGVSVRQLKRAQETARIVAIENLYNLADRADDNVLDYATKHDIAFIPWFPLGHGGLVGIGSALEPIAKRWKITPSQLALAWLLHRSPNILLIPGTTSVPHLKENAVATQVVLSRDDLRSIARAVDQAGLPSWRPVRKAPARSAAAAH
ncbi:aryl-alcohol dehydrogenase-like predicted oxidoreductase [Luteibacter sp. OK325]|uniref:aldo/keto reductase n=1 Tax=Luteibacter sp. OK325 TaxID=2135670 RepID=UPI000D375FF5|nr:aldo/keto reductase [Luteibacter sp. OK325]PTR34514.1 aryl-alcohol dehydrogenase-like predicted oxidoreductase [Luteibacter sp. OK325]